MLFWDVLLRLAQCGVPFKRADAQVLEGDPQQVRDVLWAFWSHVVFNLITQAKSHTHIFFHCMTPRAESAQPALSENNNWKQIGCISAGKISFPLVWRPHLQWFWGPVSSWVLLQALILPRIADIMKEHRGKLKQLRPVCNLWMEWSSEWLHARLQLEGHQAEGEEPGPFF